MSVVSGMLGLGVAFAAVPFLAFFLDDLVDEVQPLSLLLNGVTAVVAAIGFALSGFIEWRKAIALTVVATAFAPLGAMLAHVIPVDAIWVIYLGSVAYLAYRLFRPVVPRPGTENFRLAMILAAPIAVLSGLLGIGPGFLLIAHPDPGRVRDEARCGYHRVRGDPPIVLRADSPPIDGGVEPGAHGRPPHRGSGRVVHRCSLDQPVRAGTAREARVRRADRADDGVQGRLAGGLSEA